LNDRAFGERFVNAVNRRKHDLDLFRSTFKGEFDNRTNGGSKVKASRYIDGSIASGDLQPDVGLRRLERRLSAGCREGRSEGIREIFDFAGKKCRADRLLQDRIDGERNATTNPVGVGEL
jgi:hypothetical protein